MARPTYLALIAAGACLALVITACGTTYIGDTKIPDTEENRAVYQRLMEYRQAVEERDADRLRAMVSREYYENATTTDTTEDDYGYEFLTGTVLNQLQDNIIDVNLRILVRRISIDDERAYADYEYFYQFRYSEGGVTGWEQKNDFNRLEFVREDERWKVIGGL